MGAPFFDFFGYSLVCILVLIIPFAIVFGVVAAFLGRERGSKSPKKVPCNHCKRLMHVDDIVCPHCGHTAG